MKMLIAILLLVVADFQAVPAPQAGPRVEAARRTMEYHTVDMRTMRPADEASDVLLLIELAGMTAEEFQQLKPTDIHLMADGRRYDTVMTGAGLVNGKTEIHILFSVPKMLIRMELLVGTHPPITFSAAKTIEPAIRRAP